MVRLRENEILAHEVDVENREVLELAVNQETLQNRILRILPPDQAILILQMFICNDNDESFIADCLKVLKFIEGHD